MDNPVFLDEEIPFVESGVYEIDEATGGGNGAATTLGHASMMSLNHQSHHFDDDPMWSTTVPVKRGRRPKSAAVVITTPSSSASSLQKPEPKRRGRKPKQETLAAAKSLSSANHNNELNDILSESTESIGQKQTRRATTGARSNKKIKNDEQQQLAGSCTRVPPDPWQHTRSPRSSSRSHRPTFQTFHESFVATKLAVDLFQCHNHQSTSHHKQ